MMATAEDIKRAEDQIKDAVKQALREYLGLIERTVFADPSRPDWLVWPAGVWQQLVTEIVVPVVAAEFERVLQEEAAEGVLTGAVVAAAVATFLTEFQQVVESQTIPDRVLQETQAEVAADPTGAGVAALLAVTAPVWAGPIAVFGMNAGSFAVNAAAFTAATGAVAAAVAATPGAAPSVVKVWHALDDERTRPTHAAADRQQVPVGDVFTIGGFPLRFPHDPFGPPQEIMNCRCYLSFRSS